MSLYNMINGVNPATFFILPMLGKHPDSYPRFRDCFIGKASNSEKTDQFGIPLKQASDNEFISVYTRVGGGNREAYQEEIAKLQAMPNYVEDYDDDFDSTFATFVFRVPEEFKSDFIAVKEGNLAGLSDAYKARMYETFPKLKEKFDELLKEPA